jgi:hypothetical protein
MQIATILSLTGSVTCVGLFTKQKNFLLAIAFVFSTIYTVLDKVVRTSAIPAFVVTGFAYLFFVLLAYDVFRKVLLK